MNLKYNYGMYLRHLITFDGAYRTAYCDNSYDILLSYLYDTEFISILEMDDNRIADAIEMREEYLVDIRVHIEDYSLKSHPISVLEVLIALARRYDFMTKDNMNLNLCFWDMIENTNLKIYHDNSYQKTVWDERTVCRRIESIVSYIMCRKYSYNGKGGLFPITNSKWDGTDMTKVELFMQMHAYINDNDL